MCITLANCFPSKRPLVRLSPVPYGTVSACIRRGHLFGSTQLLLVAEGSLTTTLNGLRPNIIKCALYEVVKSSVACSPRMLRITTREIAIKHLKVDPPGMVRHAVLPKETSETRHA